MGVRVSPPTPARSVPREVTRCEPGNQRQCRVTDAGYEMAPEPILRAGKAFPRRVRAVGRKEPALGRVAGYRRVYDTANPDYGERADRGRDHRPDPDPLGQEAEHQSRQTDRQRIEQYRARQ